MKDKKQFLTGIAAGFVITMVLVEAVMFGQNVLADMESESRKENGQLDLTGSGVEAKLEEIQALMETYYLEETKAPDGYNKLGSLVEVEIKDADNSATVEDDTYVKGGIEVENKAGSLLPSTGGMGTTLIYIAGAVLVIGAGVLLVVRRRMNAEQ